MKIFLSGYYGAKNLGDELLLLKVIEDILSIAPQAEFFVWSIDKDFTNRFLKDYPASAVDRFSPADTVKAVKSSDLVVLGGGGIVQEYYGIKIEDLFKDFGFQVVSYAVPPFLGKLFGKKVFYWCLGHGPVVTEEALYFSRWFYSLADCITVRDEVSFEEVSSLVAKEKVYLDGDPLLHFDFKRWAVEKKEPDILGVSIRWWFFEETLVEKVGRALRRLLFERPELKIALIPCDLNLDLEVLGRLQALLPEDRLVRFEIESIEDIVRAISLCQWFVAMRLHSLICAYRLRIPFLALSYDGKTEEFVKSVGAQSVKATDLTEEELFLKLKVLLDAKPLEEREFSYRTPEIFRVFIEEKGEEPSPLHKGAPFFIPSHIQDFVETLLQQREVLQSKISDLQRLSEELRSENEELRRENEALKAQNEELRRENEELRGENEELRGENEELRGENEELRGENESLRVENEELMLQRDYYINKLNEIYTSNFWKVARTCYKIIYNTPFKYVYKLIRPNRFMNLNQNEKINPYENLKILKPIEVKVVDERFEIKDRGLKFSVITPVRNEGESIYSFLCKIKDQTLKPEEVIIVENSSTDNTLSEIQRFIKDYGKEVNIKLIVSKEKGLAKDRNIGIKEANNEILILLDAGVEFGNDLFEMLLATLSEFPSADLIAGIYEPTVENIWAKSFVWDWKSIDYSNYIPSSRCLLVKKSKVLSMGGYPEFLPYTGEDTLFAIRYRKISNLWVINKRIKVLWHAPTNKKEALKKAFLYGWGDGLIGLGEFRYYKELSKWLKSGDLKKWWIKSRFIRHPVIREHFKGFLKGRKERNEYLRNDINGVWLVLSLVPFTDSGGGQRGTQLSLELMKNKNKVVFCNVYPSFEEKKEVYLDIEPELLELYQIKDFNMKDFWERHKMFSEELVVLLEAPHPEFIPIVNQVKSLNPQTKVIYDCIDNWDSSLGWIWYKKEIEDEVISLVDFITVSAETLRERMQSLTSKPIYLIPNAVNTRVFKKDGCCITPKDLPTDKPIAIYVGAMWGEWFDWDLLYEIAKEFNINLVLIGNCPQERLSELKKYENIYYLGLRPQFELPAYLSQAKIALIPFKYDDKIIKYTNPLKVYEYLAMGLPVVATYMDELVGLPYVFLSKTYEEFKENIKRTLELVVDYARLKDFVENNSWTARVRKLLEIVRG